MGKNGIFGIKNFLIQTAELLIGDYLSQILQPTALAVGTVFTWMGRIDRIKDDSGCSACYKQKKIILYILYIHVRFSVNLSRQLKQSVGLTVD